CQASNRDSPDLTVGAFCVLPRGGGTGTRPAFLSAEGPDGAPLFPRFRHRPFSPLPPLFASGRYRSARCLLPPESISSDIQHSSQFNHAQRFFLL
ncbi:hypothetical protein, partial [Erwinia sp.]|uniref:hypothetical protein n=1 Tax=Erwinia citreus TaxID=558 RepID=UPI00289F6B74